MLSLRINTFVVAVRPWCSEGTQRSRKYSLKVFGANATLSFKDFLKLVAKGQEAANSWPDGYAVKKVADGTRVSQE